MFLAHSRDCLRVGAILAVSSGASAAMLAFKGDGSEAAELIQEGLLLNC